MQIHNKYVVYSHSVDGEEIYIGKGRSHRPYNFNGRNETWHSMVKGKDVQVKILAVLGTSKEAERVERQLISLSQPVANYYHTLKYASPVGRTNSRPVVDIETGEWWPSVTEAGRQLGTCRKGIQRKLAGEDTCTGHSVKAKIAYEITKNLRYAESV